MSGRGSTEYLGGVAEPRAGGRMVDLHRIERDGEPWLLLAAPGERLRVPEELAGPLGTLLRAYKPTKRASR